MKSTIIGTLQEANKKEVKGFGILEVDDDLLRQQMDFPMDVTSRCRERKIERQPFDMDLSEFADISELFGKEVDKDSDALREDAKPKLWAFHGFLVEVSGLFHSDDQRRLLVQEAVWKREKRFKKLESMAQIDIALQSRNSREPIPEKVREFVWRRDQGRCVQCGSNEKLEYDHIIPISEGGANTERNIQLLCELCNRQKGAKI
jgi:hypothetical protein